MSATFYSGSDWKRSSNPGLHINTKLADLWPEGSGSSKDDLADGDHPVLAIGPATAADADCSWGYYRLGGYGHIPAAS